MKERKFRFRFLVSHKNQSRIIYLWRDTDNLRAATIEAHVLFPNADSVEFLRIG